MSTDPISRAPSGKMAGKASIMYPQMNPATLFSPRNSPSVTMTTVSSDESCTGLRTTC